MSFTVTIEPNGDQFTAHPDETLLQAARRSGLSLPHECGWGSCSTCKVTLVAGETELMFPAAPAISPRHAHRSDHRLPVDGAQRPDHPPFPAAPSPLPVPDREQRAELIGVEELAPEVRRFTFHTEAAADFLPGQYAILHLGPRLRRAYSMCNLPDGRTLQFISKRYAGGAGSMALSVLAPGDTLELESPFGTCTLNPRPGRKLFVAGGTGISPILSSSARQVGTASILARPSMVTALAVRRTWRRETASRGGGGAPGRGLSPACRGETPDFATGRATDAISAIDHDPQATEFYVAGPPVMVAAVKSQLKEAGVPITRVHYDSFG